MPRVTLSDLVHATGGRLHRAAVTEAEICRVETDSRQIRPGDVFWALRGERHDGHEFLEQARQRGATAAIVDERHDRINGETDGPLVIVRDTREALKQFARWSRERHDAFIVGVTGSVGKTTTREMVYATLSTSFRGVRSPRNYNNEIGLPLSLLALESDHEFAVLEMGASRRGEIRELAAIAGPDVGVVTAVGAAHLEGFGDLESIALAKRELVESLPVNGFAVLAGDDPRVRAMADAAPCPTIFVGQGADNDWQAGSVHVENNRLEFVAGGERYAVNATGRHHLTAALTAVAVGREVGLTPALVSEGLERFLPANGRCRCESIGPWTVVDDTYNANPNSMRAACELLRDWNGGRRKILVAGDMLELGAQSAHWHRTIGRAAAEAGIDNLLVYGAQSRHVVEGALSAGMPVERLAEFEDFDALLTVLDCWLRPGDVVLVKGSRGMRMERVVEWLQQDGMTSPEERSARNPVRACA